MKRVETLSELRNEYAGIHSCATDTDRWLAEAFMFLIDRGFGQPNGKPKRNPSAYNRFFGQGMKAGKSPRQIADEWKARK